MLKMYSGLAVFLTPLCAPNGGFSEQTCPTLNTTNAKALQRTPNDKHAEESHSTILASRTASSSTKQAESTKPWKNHVTG